MSAISALKFMFISKGPRGAFQRFLTVKKRFALSPKKQIDFIKHYISLLKKHNFKATFFISAKILEKHIQDLEAVSSDSIEWGIHGFIHKDMSELKPDELKEHISRAVAIFDRYGIAFRGFRAPYLRANIYNAKILAESGRFLYDSSTSIIWDEFYGQKHNYFNWVNNFYNPILHSDKASLPNKENVLIELPVSLPDDDILIDKEIYNAEEALLLWKNILRFCHEKNEMFILQLHPERIFELNNTLEALMVEARKLTPPLWITTLTQLAEWKRDNGATANRWPSPYQGAFCLTGDIDSITIQDFIDR